jgi:hypothetical protein
LGRASLFVVVVQPTSHPTHDDEACHGWGTRLFRILKPSQFLPS